MLKQIRFRDITWIDLESPTKADLDTLAKEYDLHPLVLDQLIKPSTRSKLDVYTNFLYLVLNFPLCQMCYGEEPSGRDSQEVDFIIGQKFLITAHYEHINALNDFGKIFESEMALKRYPPELHAGMLFYHIIRELYGELELGLNAINDRLRDVQKKVFSQQQREMVYTLATINRDLMDFRWALKNHKEVLQSLELAAEEMFGPNFRFYLRSIIGEYQRVWTLIRSNRQTFLDLRETNDSLLSIKTNETVKVLTVVAFIFLPLTILSQMLSINATWFPIVGTPPYGFLRMATLMAVVTALTFWIATRQKWI